MRTLTTDRLTLRPWRATDVDFVFDLYSRMEVQRYIGVVPRVMADCAEAAERIANWQALEHPVHAVWAVELDEGAELVGTLLLKPIPASGTEQPLRPSADTEIGWHFHPDRWGHGYAAEAAAAVLRHGFDGGLDRVVAVTNPRNLASQRVCARIGMTHVGQTQAYYNATCELFEAVAPQPAVR